jgi:hypothetical protein
MNATQLYERLGRDSAVNRYVDEWGPFVEMNEFIHPGFQERWIGDHVGQCQRDPEGLHGYEAGYSTEKHACMAMVDYFSDVGLDADLVAGAPCLADLDA